MIVLVTIDLTFTSLFPRDTVDAHRIVQSRSSGGAIDIGKTKTAVEWVEDKKTAITLTFVRNNSSDKWDFEKKFGAKHSSMDFEKVKAFFTEHVKVKVLDSSNLRPLESLEVSVMERTSILVGEYEELTRQKLK